MDQSQFFVVSHYFLLSVVALSPVPCGDCVCFFDHDKNENIFNCSQSTLVSLPDIPKHTDTFIFTGSNISTVSRKFIEQLSFHKSLETIDLRQNKIRQIEYSKQINMSNIKELFLSGNPFHCDCEITWMIPWLNNFSNIVKDYKQVKCGKGRFKGIPVHVLTDVALGCYPHNLTLSQKVAIATSILVIVVVFAIITIVLKRSKEVKFLLFYYLSVNTIPKQNKTEKIENKEFDAFFCYRYRRN